MTYCKNYCEEKGISTSRLNEAQKTLYYIAENMKMDKSISKNGYFHFQMAIKALEQEPKTGHWINRHIIANTSIDMIVCSECGEEFSYDAETGISEYNYCPNCGARMSESKFFAKVAESYCKGLQDGLTTESEDKE